MSSKDRVEIKVASNGTVMLLKEGVEHKGLLSVTPDNLNFDHAVFAEINKLCKFATSAQALVRWMAQQACHCNGRGSNPEMVCERCFARQVLKESGLKCPTF